MEVCKVSVGEENRRNRTGSWKTTGGNQETGTGTGTAVHTHTQARPASLQIHRRVSLGLRARFSFCHSGGAGLGGHLHGRRRRGTHLFPGRLVGASRAGLGGRRGRRVRFFADRLVCAGLGRYPAFTFWHVLLYFSESAEDFTGSLLHACLQSG